MKNPNTIEEEDQTTLVDEVSPDLPYAKTYLQSLQPPLVMDKGIATQLGNPDSTFGFINEENPYGEGGA